MINYDKEKVKSLLTESNIFDLLSEWGGNPTLYSTHIVADTICHNKIGEGSHKLYYYFNTRLFQCYSNCGSFDIFELYIKIKTIQKNETIDLNTAIRQIANHFGINGEWIAGEPEKLEDWAILEDYDRIQKVIPEERTIVLKEYDKAILSRLNYSVRIEPWEKDNISREVMQKAQIGYYPGGDQISIPHYDQNNRFVGLRGRTLCLEEAEKYGKYMPIKINGIMYNHPLGMNLYGLNWAKDNIRNFEKAIVFESEKSVLQYMTKFGIDNSIAVACCGSNLSFFQVNQLVSCGAKEIIIAYDKQYKQINDEEYLKWIKKLKSFYTKYASFVKISYILDKKDILGYKDSPIETTTENFLTLFKERIILWK